MQHPTLKGVCRGVLVFFFNLKSHNFKPQLLEVAPHRVSVVVGLHTSPSCISLGGGGTPHLNVGDVAAVTCYSHFDLLASIQKQDKKLQEGKKKICLG